MNKRNGKIPKHISGLCIAAAMAVGAFFSPSKAYAQCENPFNATNQFNQMANDIVDELNDFIQQEENFIDEKLTHTATYEMELRLYQFDTNIRTALTDWWNNDYLPAMKASAKQLSAARVDQSRTLGSLTDAENENETIHDYQKREVEARQRYTPSEAGCILDSSGSGTSKGYKMSRAFAAATVRESTDDRLLKKGSPGANGTGGMTKWAWDKFASTYCDPSIGDQGCATPGPMAGKNRDMSGMLWGSSQTIDMTDPKNRAVFNDVMRTFIGTTSIDPIPKDVVDHAVGRQAMLDRRADTARMNTIYNTISQMMAERVGGSGVNTQDIRVEAGLPPGDASTDASYREIQQAMTKDRFRSNDFIQQLVNNPAALARTQGAVNAIKLQQMNDIYHRMEERVFMEAATYSKKLDSDMPDDSQSAAQMK